MQITDETVENKYVIKSCSEEGITVNEVLYKDSLYLRYNEIVYPWSVRSIKDLRKKDLSEIIKTRPEVIIIGSGKQQFYLNNKLLFLLYSNKIGCEVMQTKAACKTYNLLCLDNRKVCGLFFPL